MSLVQPPAQSRVVYDIRPGCLRALSSLLLKTSKDGECTVSLGSYFHCSTVFTVEKFPFIQSEPLLFEFMPIVSQSPTIHHLTEQVLQPLTI